MAEPLDIKPDPEEGSPLPQGLDDADEDVDDLEFYDPTDRYADGIYLARVPTYLWQAMNRCASQDVPVPIGQIRQVSQTDAQGVKQVRLRAQKRSSLGQLV